MSLFNFLMANRTKEDLAKELVATAKENAALRDRVGVLSTELFWMKAQERNAEEPKFCAPDGTGECSCRKFGCDPAGCDNLKENT